MTGSGENGISYNVIVGYADPGNEKNYYHFLEYVNGVYIDDYNFDDRLTNGLIVKANLNKLKRTLQTRDIIEIEMQCIDKSVYEYFNSFENLDGGPMNSTMPANPYTNIQGAVLGYFSAHTVMRKIFVVN